MFFFHSMNMKIGNYVSRPAEYIELDSLSYDSEEDSKTATLKLVMQVAESQNMNTDLIILHTHRFFLLMTVRINGIYLGARHG